MQLLLQLCPVSWGSPSPALQGRKDISVPELGLWGTTDPQQLLALPSSSRVQGKPLVPVQNREGRGAAPALLSTAFPAPGSHCSLVLPAPNHALC